MKLCDNDLLDGSWKFIDNAQLERKSCRFL